MDDEKQTTITIEYHEESLHLTTEACDASEMTEEGEKKAHVRDETFYFEYIIFEVNSDIHFRVVCGTDGWQSGRKCFVQSAPSGIRLEWGVFGALRVATAENE